ncbi:Predicted arabinose efflux permease, MFS family [Agreia bicolorata]|uniref:Predicted arabinose efflux permease, MFS family n=1 Tax=Agreia bicolorata TaxID=110935 RepID=A0A1T4YI53_9MICO|nr:MFS transporter [Agreia bicolorata]SKB00905.1 Predicted arabinose efflux permease, MFS family [Agreia bicolorata]
MFRSLSSVNYRIWFAGALVSNVGTWMQRTAQDWIVLTELTDHDAAAVGIVMALQLGPQLLLVPWSGLIADRLDRRRTLMVTQASMGVLGLGLGLIVVTGVAQLWHVYMFALLLGIASAIDAPVRQTFVSELVGGSNLSNAVALNSASFNAARMIGPAVAGLLVAVIGAGWVFMLNAATFGAVLASLTFIRVDQLRRTQRAPQGKGQLLEGFRYVRARPDLLVIFVIVFIIGTFGMNFAIFTSTMASVEFGQGSAAFGVLSSVMAVGSVTGALLSARRDRPRLRLTFVAAAAFGVSCLVAAIMPSYWGFAVVLVFVGLSAQTLMTTANGTVQTTTAPEMRGRVMALYMAVFMGGTPLGAPIVGWVANTFGPRWAIGVAAAAGLVAAAIGLGWLIVFRHLRLHYDSGAHPHFVVSHDGRPYSRGRSPETAEELEEDLALDEADARRS